MRATYPMLFLMMAGLASYTWADEDDGPGRGVARISVINGEVSVRRGDSGDLMAATINAPLVVQDTVLTGLSSRAEVQFDYANMIRLASMAEIRLAELEYERYLVQVVQGTVTFRVLRDTGAETEISTPSVSVRPMKKGTYRITVQPDGSSEITVRTGAAEIYTPRGTERLRSGRTMMARGSPSDPEFTMANNIPHDDWDRWNESRDRDLERARSYQYVSRDVYGAEDLDGHGRWVSVAPYGWVWSPRVAVGWAPYRHGRWVWIDWYGWSWVSYDPWGWAPYHYGRWFHGGTYGWCWYPGHIRARHYWRPALVAFFGWGRHSGVHIGVGFGSIGWVPLAPYEPYYPWYGSRYYRGYRDRVYVDNSVRVVNNINITNVYRNARVRNGYTAVDAYDFTHGRAGRYIDTAGVDLRRANLVKGQIPVAPSRDSLRLSDREVRAGNLPQSRGGDKFFSRRTPQTIERVSFEDQRRGMEEIARRTVPDRSGAPGGTRTEAAAGAQPGASGFVQGRAGQVETRIGNTNGWRSVSGSGVANRSDTPVWSGAPNEGGWRRFGEPTGSGSTRAERSTAQPGRTRQDGYRQIGEGTGRTAADGWRRFGNPATENRPPDRGVRQAESDTSRGRTNRMEGNSAPVRSDPNNWRRFESNTTSPERSGRPGSAGGVRSERYEPSRMTPRDEGSRSGSGWSASEPIRINPPIVRERAPSRSDGGSRMERGGMSRSGSGWNASEPIRINPPIVRERTPWQSDGGSRIGRSGMSRGGSGGGARMERSIGGGGGGGRSGGASRSNSGGGGGRESRGGRGR